MYVIIDAVTSGANLRFAAVDGIASPVGRTDKFDSAKFARKRGTAWKPGARRRDDNAASSLSSSYAAP